MFRQAGNSASRPLFPNTQLLDLAMRKILDSEIASQAVNLEMTSDSVR